MWTRVVSLFKNIPSFFSSILSKVYIYIIIALVAISGLLYWQNSDLQDTKLDLNKQIVSLEYQNNILSQEIKNLKKSSEAAIKAREKQIDAWASITSKETDSLVNIGKLQNRNNNEIRLDDPLPDDFTSLLKQHCSAVSGKECTNP